MIVDKENKRVIFSRRALLKGASAAGITLAGASALGTMADLAMPKKADAATTFYKGCDVSWAQQMEATGYWFYNSSGVKTDIFAILASYGCNAIRLRTWVNPSTDPVNGNCSATQTAAMAARAKAAGMAVYIDIHYGDTWNSVGTQNPPAAWASYTYSQMLSAVYNYTYSLMEDIKYVGVTPTWVSIGNEINSGLLHPIGSVSIPAQMTGLIMAGRSMVKEVFPNAQTMIHLAQPQTASNITPMLSGFFGNGGDIDILGFSSYGDYTVAASIVADMAGYASTYGKPFMQVEFGGPSNSPGHCAESLSAYVAALRSDGGQGFFYWEPEVYSPFDTWGDGAWQTNGEPIATIMNAFKAA